jgi:spectinomycin phosphotransferase
MQHPPAEPSDAVVLDAVRRHWSPTVDEAHYLPVGFGAHHWVALEQGRERLFVTLDPDAPRHTAVTLDGAYRAGAALAADGLEFLVAPLPAGPGEVTVAVAGGRLSVTPWIGGTRPEDESAVAPLVARLHAAPPPPDLPAWAPLVGRDLPDRLRDLTAATWRDGPHGETARALVTGALRDVAGWTTDYLSLAARTDPASWVPTHGEPGVHNQLLTTEGRLLLVDLESLKLAPRERDLAALLPLSGSFRAAYDGPPPDADLLRMFDLEWRLDEIGQYAAWFAGPHGDSPDDRTALGGLREELSRPDRPTG